jgi:uncharacterized protein (DUF736 family)
MPDLLTNFIKIDGAEVAGNIATLAFDIDVTGETVGSENNKAPVFRLFARSPRGRWIDVGGIWERRNAQDKPYYTLALNTGHGRWYANLGRMAGQDDDSLYAVIPNEFMNKRQFTTTGGRREKFSHAARPSAEMPGQAGAAPSLERV